MTRRRAVKEKTPNGGRPAPRDIRDLLSFRIAVLAAAGDRIGQRWLAARFGLGVMEWRVLGLVGALQPVRFSRVAGELFVDKGQLSRIVSNLRTRDLLTTLPDPDDRRALQLALTPAGEEVHTRALARAAERNAQLVAALEPAELDNLTALLDRLRLAVTARAGRLEEPDSSMPRRARKDR